MAQNLIVLMVGITDGAFSNLTFGMIYSSLGLGVLPNEFIADTTVIKFGFLMIGLK
jgi:hypothetical protein